LLLKNCLDIIDVFANIDILNLEDFAVRGRYPHDFIIPTAEETKLFYQIDLAVKEVVLKELAAN